MSRYSKPRYQDLTGQQFGKLTVLENAGPDKHGKQFWLCQCECGNQKKIRGESMKYGLTISCGCRRKETLDHGRLNHGLCRHPNYRLWYGMVNRCTNPDNKDWADYGGRGIKVCERWLKIENFIEDMGVRPAGMSIDRIDPDGDYEPSNCRWATAMQQGANKRNNVIVTLNGVTGHVAEVARLTGIPETTVRRNGVRVCQ